MYGVKSLLAGRNQPFPSRKEDSPAVGRSQELKIQLAGAFGARIVGRNGREGRQTPRDAGQAFHPPQAETAGGLAGRARWTPSPARQAGARLLIPRRQ